MTRLVVGVLLAALVHPGAARADGWTGTDTACEAAALVVIAMDWRQTAFISKNPSRFFERNPLLGAQPGRARVDLHFGASLALHALAASVLPNPYRRTFQVLTIGIESALVARNARIGVRMEF